MQSHYRTLFDAVQDILYVRDMEGNLLDINEAGERFFGVRRNDLIGRTLHRQVDDDQARSLHDTNRTLLEHGVDRSIVELRDGSSALRLVETTTTLIRDGDGKPTGAFGVMRDVTESVHLQRSLAAANDELRRLTQILEEDNARKSFELEEARLVHQSLLPKDLPHLDHLDIAVHMRTAAEVGGDYYDVVLGEKGSVTLAVGDATGHGLRAGFLGATAKSYFQTMGGRSPVRETIEAMAVAFRNLRLPSLYMCLLLVRVESRQAFIVGAAMPPLLLRHARTGTVERIDVRGTPLGFHGPFACDERVISFEEGDALLVASDGLSDLFNNNGEELGYERIERCLADSDASAEEIVERVFRLADEWSAGRPIDDDITVMALRAK